MSKQVLSALDRRSFLVQVVPACSLACLCAGRAAGDEAAQPSTPAPAGQHKFEIEYEQTTTALKTVSQQYRSMIDFIKTLQGEMEEDELVRLLELYSADHGRRVGKLHAERSPDTSFATFVANFRPPRYDKTLTLEIVEDTDTVFALRVTECVWAKVFRDAGLGGRIGYATICNMDHSWPPAFNPTFKMERDKTLMQGDDCCNHRYIATA